jgi:hypothetical protein
VLAVMETFPGAEIVSVRTIAQAEAPEGSATETEDDDDD